MQILNCIKRAYQNGLDQNKIKLYGVIECGNHISQNIMNLYYDETFTIYKYENFIWNTLRNLLDEQSNKTIYFKYFCSFK